MFLIQVKRGLINDFIEMKNTVVAQNYMITSKRLETEHINFEDAYGFVVLFFVESYPN